MPDNEIPKEEIEGNDDVYSENVRENMVEDGEMTAAEEGFLEGASGGGQGAKCRKCGKVLSDDFIERRSDDNEILRFCCDECCDKYFEEKK
jgi:hypothetical protein